VFEVETRTVSGRPAAVGSAGPYTLVVDRPADGGGDGIGFNGGQLLYLAIAGCVSNDLYRELREFVEHVDRIAEIPNSLRGATDVKLVAIKPSH
jgi:uncharacterized OsmC-like protein